MMRAQSSFINEFRRYHKEVSTTILVSELPSPNDYSDEQLLELLTTYANHYSVKAHTDGSIIPASTSFNILLRQTCTATKLIPEFGVVHAFLFTEMEDPNDILSHAENCSWDNMINKWQPCGWELVALRSTQLSA
jgi:hypothetical protein